MQELKETFVSREEIFEGRVLHVVRDRIQLPNGKESTREVALHKGAVAVVALDEDRRVMMVHQYRYPMGRVEEEIPAGKLDTVDEEHLSAAKRELREETGLIADSWVDLGMYDPSPAILSERIHLYLAEKLHQGDVDPDEDEFLQIGWVTLEDAVERILKGEITDGKTQCALLRVFVMKQKKYI